MNPKILQLIAVAVGGALVAIANSVGLAPPAWQQGLLLAAGLIQGWLHLSKPGDAPKVGS